MRQNTRAFSLSVFCCSFLPRKLSSTRKDFFFLIHRVTNSVRQASVLVYRHEPEDWSLFLAVPALFAAHASLCYPGDTDPVHVFVLLWWCCTGHDVQDSSSEQMVEILWTDSMCVSYITMFRWFEKNKTKPKHTHQPVIHVFYIVCGHDNLWRSMWHLLKIPDTKSN